MILSFGVDRMRISLSGLEAAIDHWHRTNLNKMVTSGGLWMQRRRIANAAKIKKAIQLIEARP